MHFLLFSYLILAASAYQIIPNAHIKAKRDLFKTKSQRNGEAKPEFDLPRLEHALTEAKTLSALPCAPTTTSKESRNEAEICAARLRGYASHISFLDAAIEYVEFTTTLKLDRDANTHVAGSPQTKARLLIKQKIDKGTNSIYEDTYKKMTKIWTKMSTFYQKMGLAGGSRKNTVSWSSSYSKSSAASDASELHSMGAKIHQVTAKLDKYIAGLSKEVHDFVGYKGLPKSSGESESDGEGAKPAEKGPGADGGQDDENSGSHGQQEDN